MKKFWETTWNWESEDGTWEILVYEETKTVNLEFWDYQDQGSGEEMLKNKATLILTFEQYQSLLEFSNKMNKIVWDSVPK